MRLATVMNQGNAMARVYYDAEYSEYKVTFTINGSKLPNANYFTDDFDDAKATAQAELGRIAESPVYEAERLYKSFLEILDCDKEVALSLAIAVEHGEKEKGVRNAVADYLRRK